MELPEDFNQRTPNAVLVSTQLVVCAETFLCLSFFLHHATYMQITAIMKKF